MAIASLYFPNFPFQVEAKNNPSLFGKPVVIYIPSVKESVFDISPEASRYGIERGMNLREALSLCPFLIALPFSKEKYEEAFDKILDLLFSLTPLLEREDYFIFLDIRHIKEKKGICFSLLRLLKEKTSFEVKIGVASNKFVAKTASILSKEVLFVPSGFEREFLKEVPLDYLPCDKEIIKRLRLYGVEKIGEISIFPLSSLCLRFGKEGERILKLSLGIDTSPFRPLMEKKEIRAGFYFESPVFSISELLKAIESLLNRILLEKGSLPSKLMLILQFLSGKIERNFFIKNLKKEAILSRIESFLKTSRRDEPVSFVEIVLSGYKPKRAFQLELFRGKWGEKILSAIEEIKERYGRDKIKWHETYQSCY